MHKGYIIPEQIREISRHMKVIYLGHVTETKDPWVELTGMFTIGKKIDVEELIEKRWLEYDENLGF